MKTVRALGAVVLLGFAGCMGTGGSGPGGRGWVPPEVHFTIPITGPGQYTLAGKPVAGEKELTAELQGAVQRFASRGSRVSVQFALYAPIPDKQFEEAKAAARAAGALPWERLLGEHSGEGDMVTVTITDVSGDSVGYRLGDQVIRGGPQELFARLAALAREYAAAGKRCSVRVLVGPDVPATMSDIDVAKAAVGSAALEFRTLGYRLKGGGIVGPAVGGRDVTRPQKD
jgi:hypothetical protein